MSLTFDAFVKAEDPNDGSLLIYECGWSGCDYQYEDIQDLMIHVMENGGHLGGGESPSSETLISQNNSISQVLDYCNC